MLCRGQFGLEAVARVPPATSCATAAGEACGEDHAVVGQHAGRQPVAGYGGAEDLDHGGAGDPRERHAGQQQPGMVVEEVEDLHVAAGSQPVVGEVGLPHLVRELGFEPQVGRFRSFLRLGGDVAVARQDPPHRRRRHRRLVVLGEVPADGVCAGVEALLDQLLAQPQHPLDHVRAGR